MKDAKLIAINRIRQAIALAKAEGFLVVVATDEEANAWNEINPQDMIYGDTKENIIALGVWKYIDEEKVFGALGGNLIENCITKAKSKIINK